MTYINVDAKTVVYKRQIDRQKFILFKERAYIREPVIKWTKVEKTVLLPIIYGTDRGLIILNH